MSNRRRQEMPSTGSAIKMEAKTVGMIDLLEIQGLFPNILQEGFSANKASFSVSSSDKIANWSVDPPFFSSSSFDAASGVYTVPVTGVYAIQATISYVNTAINVQLSVGSNPFFVIRKITPTPSDLITGQVPVFNTSLVLLNLRTILSGSTITFSGVVELTEGHTLGLYYEADGLATALSVQDIQWSAFRLM